MVRGGGARPPPLVPFPTAIAPKLISSRRNCVGKVAFLILLRCRGANEPRRGVVGIGA